jgi:hypothetical protein
LCDNDFDARTDDDPLAFFSAENKHFLRSYESSAGFQPAFHIGPFNASPQCLRSLNSAFAALIVNIAVKEGRGSG